MSGAPQVNFTIYPESVGTGQSRIDAFLRSDAVFDAANSPEIQFRSTSVKRTSDTTALVTGRLTARGKTFAEKFTAELGGLKGGTIKFHVTGKVLQVALRHGCRHADLFQRRRLRHDADG